MLLKSSLFFHKQTNFIQQRRKLKYIGIEATPTVTIKITSKKVNQKNQGMDTFYRSHPIILDLKNKDLITC
jgi:hypothetical protein